MKHVLGKFFEYLAAFLMFAFSVGLGYTFFNSVLPPDKPWMVWAAMGLTEFGLLCWLSVFMLQRHDDTKKIIAGLMVFACFLAVLATDLVELTNLFSAQGIVKGNPWLGQTLLYVIVAMFGCHLLAFVLIYFVSYAHQLNPQAPKQESYAVPQRYAQVQEVSQKRNLIPQNSASQEENEIEESGETEHPLAERTMRQEAEMPPLPPRYKKPLPHMQSKQESIGAIVKEGANTLMGRLKDSYRTSSTTAGRVRGKTNQITTENS